MRRAFSMGGKKRSRIREAVSGAYWSLATEIYLNWSIWTNDWETTWMV